jgi:hypothetical protein
MSAAQLVKYDAMCRAIDAAYHVDEVKDIRDKAVALETYARQAHNVEAERQACEIRLRAERKAGALSRELEKKPGARTDVQPRGTAPQGSPTKTQRLRAAGISRDQAKEWEKLAAVPEATFEAQLADRTQVPTTAGMIRASEEKVTPVSREALWLWGRLRDFERDMLAHAPHEIMGTMTPEMKDDVHTLAPRVAAWLKRVGEN